MNHICFFDIDGTLIDTGGAGHKAFGAVLRDEFGITEIDGSVQFAGRSDRAIAMDLFRSHGIEASPAKWERFYATYLIALEAVLPKLAGRVLPGVEQLISTLAERGDVALGLLTGNTRRGAELKLRHYHLWHHFKFGGFGDTQEERCDIAAAALAEAKAYLQNRQAHSYAARFDSKSVGRILVIGDTPHDIDCGRSIGARTVAVPTGRTSAEELQRSVPDVLVPTLEDEAPILKLLDR